MPTSAARSVLSYPREDDVTAPTQGLRAAAGQQRAGSWEEPFSVLLLEDNDDEIAIIRRTLRRAGVTDRPYVVRDRRVALDVLGATRFRGLASSLAELPDVILLSLDMGQASGIEVLRRIKESDRALAIPVVVLGSTLDEETALVCMDMGASMYLVKPLSFIEAMNMVVVVEEHWLALENLLKIGLDKPQATTA